MKKNIIIPIIIVIFAVTALPIAGWVFIKNAISIKQLFNAPRIVINDTEQEIEREENINSNIIVVEYNQDIDSKIGCFVVDQIFNLVVYDTRGNIIKEIGDSRDYAYQIVKDKLYFTEQDKKVENFQWLSCKNGIIQTGMIDTGVADFKSLGRVYFISNNQKRIAYTKSKSIDHGGWGKDEYQQTLYVSDIDGSKEVVLFTLTNKGEAWIAVYGWSPNDKYIYYGVLPEGIGGRIMYPGMMSLGLIDVATKEHASFTDKISNLLPDNMKRYNGNYQALSSEQKYLAYELTDSYKEMEDKIQDKLVIVDLKQDKYITITLNDKKERAVNVYFSSDNKQIAFNEFYDSFVYEDQDGSKDWGASYMHLVISDIDGKNKKNIDGNYEFFGWLDNKYIIATESFFGNKLDKNIVQVFFISSENGEIVGRYLLRKESNSYMGDQRLEGFLLK